MRRRVFLHGPYKHFHDGPIEIVADTVWDAVEAVTTMVQGFKADALTGKKVIQVVGHSTIESLKARSDQTDIHIMPAMAFGKNGGLVQTIVGATLIVIGLFIFPQIFIPAGIGMMLGGLMQMLAPQPQIGSDNAEQQRSKYLNSSSNTVRIGTTIPLGYGRFRCGGQIMSLNIDAKDLGL